MAKNVKVLIFLALIILLGSFLRLYKLDQFPPSLFGDEVDVGYQAYSILKTGKDYMGQPWPIYFHSLAEWRTPLFIYSTVPTIAIFGLNEWGVRVPAAFFGVAGIVALFFLLRQLFPNIGIALLASFFLTISPWHLQYSRAGFEVTLMLFFFLIGTAFVIKGIKENSWFFLPAAIGLSLAPYVYSTAGLFLLLLLALLVSIFRKEMVKIKLGFPTIVSLVIFLVILLPLGREIISGQALNRFQYLSVFQDTKIIEEINLTRKEILPSGFSLEQLSFGERLFHNRFLSWTKVVGNNYLQAFSSGFLFVSGDPNRRHAVGKMGELFWIDLVFILLGLLGLVYLIKVQKNRQGGLFILGWLILAPVPSSLTVDGGNHASRLFLMLPPLVTLSALGPIYLWEICKGKKGRFAFLTLLLFFLVIEFILYFHRYWVHYPKDSWRWWDVGLKEGMSYIKENQEKYPVVVMNDTFNHSLLHFLFWTAYPPEKFRGEFKGDLHHPDVLPGINGFQLGKFYFGALSEETKKTMGFVKVIKPGMLYLISQPDEVGGNWDWRTDHPNEIEVLKAITNPYGEPIYYLVTAKSL